MAGAADLKRTAEFLSHRPDIDPMRLIAVGVSAGGFAAAALAADPPPGLVAAISFAGGRGSLESDHVCRPDRLIGAFRVFGKRSRVPMLWVYAANDHFFAPALAQQFKTAFTEGGGRVELLNAPAFGNDGHTLFSPEGIPVWTSYVDTFLRQQNLMLRPVLLPSPRPNLAPPDMLSANGRKAFELYLVDAPHKAFAASRDGHFGWQTGVRTVEAAKAQALRYCQVSGTRCDILFVDDAAAPER
jgi:pimeloyl-ACP methyl ester carboxylesterase